MKQLLTLITLALIACTTQIPAPIVDNSHRPTQNANSKMTFNAMPSSKISNSSHDWLTPTAGKKIRDYSTRNKGIDFTGTSGQPIYAISNGKVIYSDTKLHNYGNCIIIRHDKLYLSIYAHNKINLVKDGQTVTRGQIIAYMGATHGQPVLHFEIRKNGIPVDPNGFFKNETTN